MYGPANLPCISFGYWPFSQIRVAGPLIEEVICTIYARNKVTYDTPSIEGPYISIFSTAIAIGAAIVFAYHNVAVRYLYVLLAQRIGVKLILTYDDDPDEYIYFNCAASFAREHNILVTTPQNPHDEQTLQLLLVTRPDFLFSFYYRKMLSLQILSIVKRGCYNMHGSLLPKYRGRVPISWATIHGETGTAATLHKTIVKPDAGAIVDQMSVPSLPNDLALDAFNKAAVAVELVLHRVLPHLIAGITEHSPIDLKSGSYFGGRSSKDRRINSTKSVNDVHNLVRAISKPYPGPFSVFPNDTKLTIWRIIKYSIVGEFNNPKIFIHDGHYYIQAVDGKYLKILDVEAGHERLRESLLGREILQRGTFINITVI